jgi:hypothetical protein
MVPQCAGNPIDTELGRNMDHGVRFAKNMKDDSSEMGKLISSLLPAGKWWVWQ